MKTHEQLISQLQSQAETDVPVFSDTLHRQVMTAVRNAKAGESAALLPRGFGVWWGAMAAAAVAMGIGIALLNPTAPAPTQIISRGKPAPIPSIPIITLVEATEPAHRSLNDARFAYLDRDAKNFGKFVKNQIDVLPHNQ